ncbi:UMP kinase [Candidatus Woesearchaeota archaeon]|nr:MAG: UMP kinase [Candidatus Woesearchaeota archaeon]
MKKEVVVIKLGGSVIVSESIKVKFLNRFKLMLEGFLYKYRFVIVCGGGSLCRTYQEGARLLNVHSEEDLDKIGVRSTMLNAELVRAMFGEYAHREICYNHFRRVRFKDVLVCSGWRPGHSSDFGAVMFGRKYRSKLLINLTDVPYVYDKDPKRFTDAKPFGKIKIEDYLRLIDSKFSPGMNVPFDPVAAKMVPKNMQIVVVKELENVEKLLNGEPFDGTILER